MSINWKGYAYLAVLSLIWGSSFILIKRGLVVFTPLELGFLRTCIGGLVFLPFVVFAWRALKPSERWTSALVGITGSLAPSLLFSIAQQEINSTTSGVLNALTPMFVVLIGLIFKAKLPKKVVIAVLVGLLGSAGLLLRSDFQIEVYAFFAIAATVFYGININIIHRYARHAPPFALACMSLCCMLPITLVSLSFTNIFGYWGEHPAETVWLAFAGVFFLGAAGTSVAFYLFNKLVQDYGTVFSSFVTYLLPVVAVIWGLWDGEMLTVVQFVGVGGILLSVYIIKSPRKS